MWEMFWEAFHCFVDLTTKARLVTSTQVLEQRIGVAGRLT